MPWRRTLLGLGPPAVLAVLLAVLPATPAPAWNGKAHMTAAYVALRRLDPALHPRVLELLSRHPDYAEWTRGVPAGRRHDAERLLRAFLHASRWPDEIKSRSGYVSDGASGGNRPPPGSDAARNIGYADRLRHKYWHFHNQPFSPDGTPLQPPRTPSLLTQVPLLVEGLRAAPSDDVRSYDLVWLIHLVADAHQPLHCVNRFTRKLPSGDDGGNAVERGDRPGAPSLHALWDGLLGGEDGLEEALALGEDLLAEPRPPGADVLDVARWVEESFELARRVAYAAPIRADGGVSRTTRAYRQRARETAETQVLLAGHRLARLLETALRETPRKR